MADNIGVYDISGQVQRVATSSLSVVHSGLSASINERREAQRERYDRLLKGVATKAQAAQSPFDSTPADPPSWTQIYSGKKHAFVISELSSSQHEVTSLNARISGTAKLENTAVSASGTLLYSKQNQLVKLVYKLTAFSASSMGPAAERSPSTIENIIRIGTAAFDQVSGTYRNNSYWNPATFEIDVPDYGKIRDLKVWVEFIHDHRGGTGTGSSDASNIFWAGGDGTGSLGLNHGLQGMQIALRSPNTNFRYAHPLWNDPTVATLEKMPQSTISDTYKRPPELLRNSYLLWAGHAVEEDLGVALGVHTRSLPTDYFLETVATGSVAGILTYPSFTINSLNLPTYCYNNAHEGRIYIMRPYSNGVALVYAKEIVTTTSNAYYTYMVLNKDKITPNILWGENSGFQTKIARSSSAGWAVDTVADAHYNDKHLAIDSNDKILILSTDSNDQLRIYDKIGSAWIGSSILPPHATFCNYNSIT